MPGSLPTPPRSGTVAVSSSLKDTLSFSSFSVAEKFSYRTRCGAPHRKDASTPLSSVTSTRTSASGRSANAPCNVCSSESGHTSKTKRSRGGSTELGLNVRFSPPFSVFSAWRSGRHVCAAPPRPLPSSARGRKQTRASPPFQKHRTRSAVERDISRQHTVRGVVGYTPSRKRSPLVVWLQGVIQFFNSRSLLRGGDDQS